MNLFALSFVILIIIIVIMAKLAFDCINDLTGDGLKRNPLIARISIFVIGIIVIILIAIDGPMGAIIALVYYLWIMVSILLLICGCYRAFANSYQMQPNQSQNKHHDHIV